MDTSVSSTQKRDKGNITYAADTLLEVEQRGLQSVLIQSNIFACPGETWAWKDENPKMMCT